MKVSLVLAFLAIMMVIPVHAFTMTVQNHGDTMTGEISWFASSPNPQVDININRYCGDTPHQITLSKGSNSVECKLTSPDIPGVSSPLEVHAEIRSKDGRLLMIAPWYQPFPKLEDHSESKPNVALSGCALYKTKETCPPGKCKWTKTKEGIILGIGEEWSCIDSCGPAGPNQEVICSATVGMTSQYETNEKAINICSPDPPIKSTVDKWVASAGLNPEVDAEKYDNAVKEIWNKVFNDMYIREDPDGTRNVNYCEPVCSNKPASGFIDGSISCGMCNHWATVLLSMIRTLGVPEDRVYIWNFATEFEGHAITAYKSDEGEWWILDTTCCNALVPLSKWKSECPSCFCSKYRYAYINDYGINMWADGEKFDGACSEPPYGW
jgi:hypothetical protein